MHLPRWLPAGSPQLGLATGLAGAVTGMVLLRGVRFLFGLGRGLEGMGVGDADLMMMAGAFVGWQPVVAAFFLLEGYTNARRSFIENLTRRSFLAVVCIAAIAAIWALWNPTFGNIGGFVAVVVLASSDVYLHTDEHQLVNP